MKTLYNSCTSANDLLLMKIEKSKTGAVFVVRFTPMFVSPQRRCPLSWQRCLNRKRCRNILWKTTNTDTTDTHLDVWVEVVWITVFHVRTSFVVRHLDTDSISASERDREWVSESHVVCRQHGAASFIFVDGVAVGSVFVCWRRRR